MFRGQFFDKGNGNGTHTSDERSVVGREEGHELRNVLRLADTSKRVLEHLLTRHGLNTKKIVQFYGGKHSVTHEKCRGATHRCLGLFLGNSGLGRVEFVHSFDCTQGRNIAPYR